MRIALVHNEYQHTGGEDTVVAQESRMLRANGHEVIEYRRSNSELEHLTFGERLTLPASIIWGKRGMASFRETLRKARPDLVHVHNTFVRISPGVYNVCKSEGLPVVQTLHNYRLLCPRADFFRDSRVCEECLGKQVAWSGIAHGCYHDSKIQSAAVAAMLTVHRLRSTWRNEVDAYIALTEFGRRKFIQGGLPAERIHVRPNCVTPDPGSSQGRGDYALFLGRFNPLVRMDILLGAWKGVPDLPLKVVGTAESPRQTEELQSRHAGVHNVDWLGWKPREAALGLLKGALLVVVPSPWYEGFPMVIAEAFACGVPVIASRLGAMAEIVNDGHTGLLFDAGDSADLARKVHWASAHRGAMEAMGMHAREDYESRYTERASYARLMEIYDCAIKANRHGADGSDRTMREAI